MRHDAQVMPSGFGKGHGAERADALIERARAAAPVRPGIETADAYSEPLITNPTPCGSAGLSFAFTAFGARVGVSLEEASLFDLVVECLPPGWMETTAYGLDHHIRLEPVGSSLQDEHERQYRLLTDDVLTRDEISASSVPDAVESVLEDLVAQCARPWLFLHAGVVGWRGRAIVLPAETFAGKSTLVAALVAAGATYFSDEYAVLDADGLVYPYPRRLSLRVGPDGWRHRRVDLGSTSAADMSTLALPIRLAASLSYRPDRAGQIEELPPAAAIMSLCQHTVAVRQRPADAFAVLGRVANSARVIRGFRGEAEETASWLLRESGNVILPSGVRG